MSRRAIVIGGGLAGITAALDLRDAGVEVTLLESRGRLGGQVFSFEREGLRLDNGQHVFLRCCTAYRTLLQRLDAEEMVTLQPHLRIPVRAPGGRQARLERTALPAPLHMARSLLGFRLLSGRERLLAGLAMARLSRVDTEDPANDQRSFGEWLRTQRQSGAAIGRLWELIVRPTLNLLPEQASLAQAAQVFQVGLLQEPGASDVGHARVPLGEIHDVAARRALAQAGVDVRLRGAAAELLPRSGGGFDVRLGRGETLRADAVVLAVPPERAARLLPSQAGISVQNLQALGRSPIVNLHIVLEEPIMDEPFLAAVDSPLQWIFDRTVSSGLERGQCVVVSLSAAEAELSMSAQELQARFLPALEDLFGCPPRVRHFFVTRDHSATFRAGPGARAHRPGPRTALRGLALAGTWTDTGWPATMESAVLSGHAAAAVVRQALAEGASTGAPGVASGAVSSSVPPADPASASGALTPPALTLLAPLGLEARALRRGAPRVPVRRIGMGPRRAAQAVQRLRIGGSGPVVLAGFCGALDDRLRPGDVVLADSLQTPVASVALPEPAILAGVLRRGGLRVHVGPVACTRAPVSGAARRQLAERGALAVDMESAAVQRGLDGQPLVVLRVVLDTPTHELHRLDRLAGATAAAYRSLRRAASLLEEWLRAFGDRELALANPRASCAGVERAVEIVERALESRGAPVYVRKQIVHNTHVIAELEQRGAVFVEEIDEVPDGATVIFSAHGVSPEVRRAAAARALDVIDATCPLVAKVHAEARRFSARDFNIVLVGHRGHEEVEGTFGEAPERTRVVAGVEEVERLDLPEDARVAYLTQTTLAQDETAGVIEALHRRFRQLEGPRSSDICYATQNRQDAVRALAGHADLVLVVGSQNSSNTRRLVEVAERAGMRAELIEDAWSVTPEMLAGARRVALTAGASAPERLVQEVVRALSALGRTSVEEFSVTTEDIRFKLPVEVRGGR